MLFGIVSPDNMVNDWGESSVNSNLTGFVTKAPSICLNSSKLYFMIGSSILA